MCYGLMKPRLNFLVIILKCMFGKKQQHRTSPKEHHTHSEAWWWQHHALGLFFFSWNWGLSQGGGNYEQFQIPVNICTKLLESWKWRGTSSFSTTTTQSIHPNQQKNGFTRRRLKFWNGPARAQTWIRLKICGVIWRGLCTGDALAIWQIWSIFAKKSGQILLSQDV